MEGSFFAPRLQISGHIHIAQEAVMLSFKLHTLAAQCLRGENGVHVRLSELTDTVLQQRRVICTRRSRQNPGIMGQLGLEHQIKHPERILPVRVHQHPAFPDRSDRPRQTA